MHSPLLLLPLAGLTVLAAPSKHLNSRSITIPGAVDNGMDVNSAWMTDITSSTTRTTLTIQFCDNLQNTDSTGQTIGGTCSYCSAPISRFEYNGGRSTAYLPTPGTYINCGGFSQSWQYKFTESNTGSGLTIGASHTITVNGGPPYARTASFKLPPLSEWNIQNNSYVIGNEPARHQLDLFAPNLKSNRGVFTETNLAPKNWKGDPYNITSH